MSCHCHRTPCCCPLATTETEATTCPNPAAERDLATFGGYDYDGCHKQVKPFRGYDEGAPILDPRMGFESAFAVQDNDGNCNLTNQPDVLLQPVETGFASVEELDGEGGIASAGINALIAQHGESGIWKRLLAKPEFEGDATLTLKYKPGHGYFLLLDQATQESLCQQIVSDVILDPEAESYLIEVASNGVFTVGVAIKLSGIEFTVTELVGESYIRVVPWAGPLEGGTIEAGSWLCQIGFRTCSGIEAEIDEPSSLVVCQGGIPKTIPVPDPESGIYPVGAFVMDRDGAIKFLEAELEDGEEKQLVAWNNAGVEYIDWVVKKPSTVLLEETITLLSGNGDGSSLLGYDATLDSASLSPYYPDGPKPAAAIVDVLIKYWRGDGALSYIFTASVAAKTSLLDWRVLAEVHCQAGDSDSDTNQVDLSTSGDILYFGIGLNGTSPETTYEYSIKLVGWRY